jgi:hypothetical protein
VITLITIAAVLYLLSTWPPVTGTTAASEPAACRPTSTGAAPAAVDLAARPVRHPHRAPAVAIPDRVRLLLA